MMSFSWSQLPNHSSSRAYLSLYRAHPSPRCSFLSPFLSPRHDEIKLSTGSGWKTRGFAVHVPVHATPGRKYTCSEGRSTRLCLSLSIRLKPRDGEIFFGFKKDSKAFDRRRQCRRNFIYKNLVKLRISRLFLNPESGF